MLKQKTKDIAINMNPKNVSGGEKMDSETGTS